MAQYPLYDPRHPEDMPQELRVAYGLLGFALDALPAPLVLTDQDMQEIVNGYGPKFSHCQTEDGLTVLRGDNHQHLDLDNRDFE